MIYKLTIGKGKKAAVYTTSREESQLRYDFYHCESITELDTTFEVVFPQTMEDEISKVKRSLSVSKTAQYMAFRKEKV